MFNPDEFGIGADKTQASLARDPKERFAEAGLAAIQALQRGETKHLCFDVMPNGNTHVTLRNGIAVLKVGGKKKRICPDVATAIRYIEAAIKAANEGQFDELFADTQLKRKA